MKPMLRIRRILVLLAIFVPILVLLLGYIVRGPLLLLAPDAIDRREVSAARLEETVTTLCTEFAHRWYTPPEDLDRAANWIAARLQETGLPVTEHRYSLMEGEYRNIVATREGTDPDLGVVIVGAHYDAYGKLPGADDNASGIAVMLELAWTLPDDPPRRTQLFVAFANEEPPLFASEDMGSYHYLQHLLEAGVRVDLMIALDLVGYYSDKPGSQRFPSSLLKLYYPSTGNFLAVVGDLGSGKAIGRVKRGLVSGAGTPIFPIPWITGR